MSGHVWLKCILFVLLVIGILVVARLIPAIGGHKTAQRRRAKLGQKVGPLLEPGEQIRSVFRAEGKYRQGFIFAVTDHAIVLLDTSWVGRPKQVRRRYSANVGLGPILKSPWGILGGSFKFDDAVYWVAGYALADFETAKAALSDIAQHQPADSVGRDTPQTVRPDTQLDSALPEDLPASPDPQKPSIWLRVVYAWWALIGVLWLLEIAVTEPVWRWVAIPLLLLILYSFVHRAVRSIHRAWVRRRSNRAGSGPESEHRAHIARPLQALLWILGGFVVGTTAAVVIPGDTGGAAALIVWVGSVVVALVLVIEAARDAMHRRRTQSASAAR